MRAFCTFLLLSISLLHLAEAKDALPLPGRLGSSEISVAEFGEMKVFFYMTPEKDRLCRDLIPIVNEEMILTTYAPEIEFPLLEITPIATASPDPIAFNDQKQPVYMDKKTMDVLDRYSERTQEILEKCLGVHLKGGIMRDMSLILNFDTNKFHQDQFRAQYEFLEKHPHPIPRYHLVQDLALIDWEMSDQTFSGTMVQDESTDDRYILTLFDKEVVGNFYVEPALYKGPNQAPEYPGSATLVPHCLFPPIDLESSSTVGSSKGKRMSVIVRALVTNEEMSALEKKSKKLPMNRPEITQANGTFTRKYPNGIVVKEMPVKDLAVQRKEGHQLPDLDNTEVFQTRSKDNKEVIVALQQLFGISCSIDDVVVKHLVKKDDGFTNLSIEALSIPKGSTVVFMNGSKVIPRHRCYNLAERADKEGLPWIQLYHFPLNSAMCVPAEHVDHLALTPMEEILFRDAREDIRTKNPSIFNEKMVTTLDVFIFPKGAKKTKI